MSSHRVLAASTLKTRYRLLLHENVESPLKIQRLTECLSQPTRCCQWFVSPEGRLTQAPRNSPP